MPANNIIQIRRGTSSEWSNNPVLGYGEPGFDVTNNILKIGDGVKTWASLSPVGTGGGGGGVSGLAAIIEDVTPQLGGNLDLNNNNITGVGNIDILGNVYVSGNYVILSGYDISLLNNDAGYLTEHPNITAVSSSDNSGRTYIQDILLDSNGHVTGLSTATETVVDTDTTYTDGTGLYLDGTQFNVDSTVIRDVNTYSNPSWITSINANIISGVINSTNLPSYVDDVLEYNGTGNFPVAGSTGIIYVDILENKTYRWAGSSYFQLTDGKATWGGIDGTLSNQTDLYSELNSKAVSGDNVSIFVNDSGYLSLNTIYIAEWTLGANGTTDYTFTGFGLTGSENDPTLYLTRGQRYKFTNNMGAHPFRIQSTPNGSVGTQYNEGITNNDVSNGTLIWDVQFDSPNILYYQCTAHASMGGKIYILDENLHPEIFGAASSNNAGRTYIQDVLLDSNGHVTGLSTATETVIDTDTTYTAGTGLFLSSTEFNISPSLISSRTEVTSEDADYLLVLDATDSQLKKVDAGEFRGGGGTTYEAGSGLILDNNIFHIYNGTGNFLSIELSSHVPSDTTNQLYNNNGVLYFNGSIISGAGGAGSGINSVLEDTTPQLGGNLDLNGNNITGIGDIFSNGSPVVVSGNNISLLTNDAGYLTAHPTITAASSSDNSGRTYIQDIILDSNGHVIGINTATETSTGSGTTVVGTIVQADGTVISDSDTFNSFNIAGGYTSGYINIYQNGVKLVEDTDFIAGDGSSVTLINYAPSGSILEYVLLTSLNDNNEYIDDRVNDLLSAGSGIDIIYDDPGNDLQISFTGIDLGTYPLITIASQPQDTGVFAGDSASFSIGATATFPTSSINYMWQKSTDDVNYVNISNSNNSTLSLTDVQISDTGYYRCYLTSNLSYKMSDSAILYLNSSSSYLWSNEEDIYSWSN